EGRIDTLFYDVKAELYGEVSPTSCHVLVSGHATDDDLVDLAAVQTIRHGGEIWEMSLVNIPTNTPLAAILRF
ncbi:MAG: hypothetical protein KDB23_23955, partial [Planctomycetales bacterium]|nr:hypothetical protein [Planctomycetales bacterium]